MCVCSYKIYTYCFSSAAVDSTYLGMHLDDLAQFCFLVHICFYIFFCCQPNASIIINYTHFLYITTTCCIHTLCAYILRGVVPFHSIHIRSVHNVLLLLWLYGTETHSICLLNCKLLPCSSQHCVYCKQSKTITCSFFSWYKYFSPSSICMLWKFQIHTI